MNKTIKVGEMLLVPLEHTCSSEAKRTFRTVNGVKFIKFAARKRAADWLDSYFGNQ